METEKLKQAYRDQLIQMGVNFNKATQASEELTRNELQLIGEIWPEWASAYLQVERLVFSRRETSVLSN